MTDVTDADLERLAEEAAEDRRAASDLDVTIGDVVEATTEITIDTDD